MNPKLGSGLICILLGSCVKMISVSVLDGVIKGSSWLRLFSGQENVAQWA